jgi:acylphosphatase
MTPPTIEKIRTHAIVHGSVTGVTFRASARRCAEQHGVSGWIRNMGRNAVEAVFEGPPNGVAAMVDWLHHGPDGAHVDRVHVVQETPEGLSAFEVR